jgi:hypothetical protein
VKVPNYIALLACMAMAPTAFGQSLFNGTWRPDPERPGPDRKPDVFQLVNGEYECQSCQPPYQIKADGLDHPINGNPYYDTLRITVVDEHTVTKTAKRAGATVVESTVRVSPDGSTSTERQILSDVGPRQVDFTSRSSRVASGPKGAHAVSGTWHLIEANLTNHDEDTVYVVGHGVLTMSDRMGRSFTAKLDGTEAPYKGDSQYTSVSVRLIDARTIEESDRNGEQIVKISRWTVDPDGKTIHARFDDTHGHVQEQVGRKISR